MALFAVAAVGLAVQVVWWGPMAVAAAGVSVVLVTLFPAAIADAWIVAPMAIDVAVIAGVVWFDMPVQMVGG
jgi:hypothetical protein